MLSDLLESLIDQELPSHLEMEIVVADNDPLGAAESVVENYAVKSEIPTRYYHEPVKNISLARNKAVSQARGEFILFIDDDEIASRTWVATMVETINKYQADCVFGRVIPIFGNNAPDWIKGNYLYHRPCGRTGTTTKSGRTSNAIVRSTLLQNVNGPFDPAYGLSGGEDSHLFHRLLMQGAKFVDCYEGYVTEYIEGDRTKPGWLRDRAIRTGIIYAQRIVLFARLPNITKLFLFTKAMVFLFISSFLMLVCFPMKHLRLHWNIKAASYTGHILGLLGKYREGY
jgi:succinoglycan biosynthesis protein ExoM